MTWKFDETKSNSVNGKGNNKQIAGMYAVSTTGKLLPMQLIYAGKTENNYP